MRRISVIGLFVFFFSISSAFCQDIIYTIKGTEIKCKVQEISEDSVSYHDVGAAPTSQLKFLIKKEVTKIKYANGLEDPITVVAPIAVKTGELPTASATTDVIFTTDGRQLAGKITEIDVDNNTISYLLAGSKAEEKINTKNITSIKYKNGSEDTYTEGKKNTIASIKSEKKNNEAGNKKDAMLIMLQNWRRTYISPPLEVF